MLTNEGAAGEMRINHEILFRSRILDTRAEENPIGDMRLNLIFDRLVLLYAGWDYLRWPFGTCGKGRKRKENGQGKSKQNVEESFVIF